MDLKKKLFGFNKNRPRKMYSAGTPEFDVSEITYECFLELTGVAFSSINRAYSRSDREKNPKIEFLWASGHAQAKEFLTRYKNIVRDNVIPLARLTKHENDYDDSQDQHTKDFKSLIVDNNLYMLCKKLQDYAPLMLPEESQEAYLLVLENTYRSVKEKLLANLAPFEAEGVLTEKDFE